MTNHLRCVCWVIKIINDRMIAWRGPGLHVLKGRKKMTCWRCGVCIPSWSPCRKGQGYTRLASCGMDIGTKDEMQLHASLQGWAYKKQHPYEMHWWPFVVFFANWACVRTHIWPIQNRIENGLQKMYRPSPPKWVLTYTRFRCQGGSSEIAQFLLATLNTTCEMHWWPPDFSL